MSRLAALEEKLTRAEGLFRALRSQVRAIGELAIPSRRRVAFTSCLASIDGWVYGGCDGTTPVGGATLDFTAQPSGLATTLTAGSDGYYSGWPRLVNGDTSLSVTVTPPAGSPFGTQTGSVGVSCNAAITQNWSLGAASGYTCLFGCSTPVSTGGTMTLHDPTFGTVTLSWNAARSKFAGSINPAYAACSTSGCSAQSSIHVGYEVDPVAKTCTIWWEDLAGLGSTCPTNSTSTSLPPFASGSSTSISAPATSSTCPPSFSATFRFDPSVNTQLKSLYCTSTAFNITVTMP